MCVVYGVVFSNISYMKRDAEEAVKRYSENRTINSIFLPMRAKLLENALHGCRESGKEKPCIEIHIRLQNNQLIIVCNNTCSDKLKFSGSLPTGKGIGISSILTVNRVFKIFLTNYA